MLRAGIGSTMIAHGLGHARTLEGTGRWFGSIGFSSPELQAKASVVVEIGAGSALLAGLGTPVAASAVIGIMAVAARTVHAKNGFCITKEGYEYVLNLSMASLALGTLGGGRYSVDHLFSRWETGSAGKRALLTAGLGLGTAGAQLARFWHKA